jgi:hypothetical protein
MPSPVPARKPGKSETGAKQKRQMRTADTAELEAGVQRTAERRITSLPKRNTNNLSQLNPERK